MDAARRLTALRTVVDEITALGPNLAPETEVPTCPGWTVEDLVDHLGRVHLWAAEATTTTERPAMGERSMVDGQTLGEWYAGCGKTLVDRLRSADLTDECWTFDPEDRTAAFWVRRQLHETTIHWVDLATAHGIEADVDADVADDGIDELLRLFVPTRVDDPAKALPLPVQVRATDTGSVWNIRDEDGTVVAARGEEGEVVGEIRGSAAELYLALWRRGSREALDVEGESAPARGLLAEPLVP